MKEVEKMFLRRVRAIFLVVSFFPSHGTTTDPVATRRCGTLAQVSQQLWVNDVSRLATEDITLNYQSKIPENSKNDLAKYKLFTSVNESKLAGPTFLAFKALLDNYDPDKGLSETLTQQERDEDDAFLTAFLDTDVSRILVEHLMCTGIVDNLAHFRSVLTKIWFDFYSRSAKSAVNDSSGFEHVMVGEYKSAKKINGFHNWLSFYYMEKSGHLNYYGYVNREKPSLIGAAFKWNGRYKTMASFFIGVSPEFDMAVFTLCYLAKPNKRCRIVLNDNVLHIQTYNMGGHIGTAYVEI